MRSKKLVGAVSALFLAALASGCGSGGGDGGASGSTGTSSGSGAANSKLSGTVADGLAMAKAKITVQSANGTTVDVGTTDDSGQYSGFSFPPGFQFPAVMSVTRTVGSGVLRSIIPSLPGTDQSANINPITQTITSQILPTGSSLANLDVTDGDLGFAKKAKTVVQTAFGTAIDYDTFAGKSFKALNGNRFQSGWFSRYSNRYHGGHGFHPQAGRYFGQCRRFQRPGGLQEFNVEFRLSGPTRG